MNEIKVEFVGSRIPAHFYSCEACIFMFAAEQALEDQSGIICPICHTDEHLQDAGSGVMILEQPAGDEEDPEIEAIVKTEQPITREQLAEVGRLTRSILGLPDDRRADPWK